MNRARGLFIGLGIVLLSLIVWQPARALLLTQQAQIGITIIVNVTPSPLAYAPHSPQAPGSAPGIVAKASLGHALTPKGQFEAQSLHFDQNGQLIAQVQHSVLVQAEVTPNPNATLLYSNYPTVTISAIAGTTVQVPCAFTVTVSTTKAWQLEEGLSNDFSSDFPGKDVGNNTYVSTPLPTSTPYLVYADDGSSWYLFAQGSAITTYCVTLTVTVPSAVSAGTFSTNAIYTLLSSA